ncbi:hypothetical protein PanWU01x14_236280 [Parasponia andersonii]|uniref:Uncharacterized protein n=1 Tax=Parasponia andersonii TaxID=3476 RepID=A0A2P5BIA3_PARAD|nr:hypothetical protein PanWU01x14_236280 [Parasponia andersonii]
MVHNLTRTYIWRNITYSNLKRLFLS